MSAAVGTSDHQIMGGGSSKTKPAPAASAPQATTTATKKAAGPDRATEHAAAVELHAEFGPVSICVASTMAHLERAFDSVSLLEEIDEKGFYKTYDYFYLPIDFANKVNMGYRSGCKRYT